MIFRRRFCFAKLFVVAMLICIDSTTPARADVTTAAVRETTEFVMKKFSKEAVEQGAESLAKQIEVQAMRHGDDALKAVKNVGPKALKAAQEAGENGGPALRAMARFGDDGLEWVAKRPQGLELAAKYGDDAAAALVKHRGVAEPVIAQFGESSIKALNAVAPQEGRRLAIMAADGELAKIGRTPELLDVVAKYGNRGADFVWNHKGALAVGAGLTAFLANPEPFIDGTNDLAKIVGENAVKPLVSMPGQVATEAAKRLDWTLFAIVGIMALAIVSVWRSYLRHRAELRRTAAK
jgi:hypothetical protein